MKEVTDILNQIEVVEVSPFLFTRIEQRIKKVEEVVPRKLSWTLAVSFACLLALNIFIMVSFNQQATSDTVVSADLISNTISSDYNFYK